MNKNPGSMILHHFLTDTTIYAYVNDKSISKFDKEQLVADLKITNNLLLTGAKVAFQS